MLVSAVTRILLLLYFVSNSKANFLISNISSLTRDIAEAYFTTGRCVAFIVEDGESHQGGAEQILLHTRIPAYLLELSTNSLGIEESYTGALEAGCQGFFLWVSNISVTMKTLMGAARRTVQRLSRKYVAIAPTLQDPTVVLNLPEVNFTPDFIVVVSREKSFELWTHGFGGLTLQEQQSPILLDEWQHSQGFKSGANLFPDKLSDLRGKPLHFATFHYPPYSIFAPGVYDGTEMRVAKEMARLLNFSWTVVTDESQWGEILDNATGNGILGNVVEDAADFGFGALYLWYHEYQFLDFSTPYIRTGVTCLAPKPAPLSGWLSPALPFSARLWAAVAASLLTGAALLCVIANVQARVHSVIYGWEASGEVSKLCQPLHCLLLVSGMAVLAPGPSMPPSAAALKHCLTWFLVQCLLLATCYASSLVSFMTVPRFAAPVDTAAELAATNLHWAATHDAWAFSLREASDPVHRKVYELFREMDEQNLREAVHSGENRLAYAVERLPAGHFAVGEYLQDERALGELRLMREDLYWEMVVTVVRKGSPYLERLNNLISRLSASGIPLFWEGEVARKFLSSRDQLAILTSTHSTSGVSDGPTILAIHHIQGVFMLLGAGLIASTFVFLLEKYFAK